MTARMIAYSDPKELERVERFKPYLGDIHLCATDSLRLGVESYYQAGERKVLTGRIVGAGLVMERLLDGWASPDTKLRQYAYLSELIDLFPTNGDSVQDKRLRAFRRNQQEVLKTMRTLTEIGMTPDQFETRAKTEEEKIFVQLWKQMEKTSRDFRRIRYRLSAELIQPEKLLSDLPKAIRSIPFGKPKQWPEVPEQIERVVLHGFYFITPLQHKFFTLLQNAGIELVFLNLYDPRYERTFASVETFIGEWVTDRQYWHQPETNNSTTTYGDLFARIFEEEPTPDSGIPASETVNVLEYRDFYDFLREYRLHPNSLDGEVEYFSPSHDPINERLKEYFPDNFKDRHFLSYPIGQFLFHLHRMWKEIKGTLLLDERSLYECFASGWLRVGDKKAADYTLVLRELLPYFEGCRTLCEWREQMDYLIEARRHVVGAFARDNDVRPETKRFHEMMGNPMLRFSFFQVREKDVLIVFELIEELLRIAEDLFGNGKVRVTLTEHFAKIDKLLQKMVPESDLLPLEHKLILFLKDQLMTERNAEEEFRLQDLSDALALYLGGEFNEGREEEPDEPDNQIGRKITKFEELDAAALFENKRIHVTGLDEESLPYHASVLPWPLSRECLIELANEKKELMTVLHREQMAPQITRYLLYSLLAFHSQVTLSWMREWQGKELEESLYLMLLEIKPTKVKDTFEDNAVTPQRLVTGDFDYVAKLLSEYPPEARKEYQLCPRRFYYSFLTQEYAVYRDSFHHSFLFSNLVTVTAALTDGKEEDAFQQTAQLFPHWLNLKKQELRENALKYVNSVKVEYDSYDGAEYLNARERFQFLNMSYFRRLLPLTTDAFLQGVRSEEEVQMRANPGYHCRFCPHLPQCQDGNYAVDDK